MPTSAINKSLPEQHLHTAMNGIWQRCKGSFIEQIKLLEQMIIDLANGKLEDDLRQRGKQQAHKLSGSLGMFGFSHGSNLTRELEKILEAETSLTPEQGLLFQERLKNLRQEMDKAKVAAEPESAINEERPLLLVVDDDLQVAQRLAIEALNTGMRVEIATKPSVAKSIIARHRPDVVLLDLSFPDPNEDGLALLAELTNQTPAIPVLVFTVQDSFHDRVKVAQLGGRGFLHKGMSPTQVLEMVTYILQRTHTAEAKVMLLDDDPVVLMTLRNLLEPWGIKLITLDNPLQFWDALEDTYPDLVILDVEMPHLSGIQLCQVVRNDPRWNRLPVLFLTAHMDSQTIHQVFAAGADDYVNKPIVGPELITRIFNRLERSQLLRSLAETDALTKVANRHKSTQDLSRFLRLAERYQQSFSLAILDLDHFKLINDQYGHAAGDRVLSRFGERLIRSFRSEDVVARWGGEEFIVGMYGMNRSDGVIRLVELLENWQKEEFIAPNGGRFRVTFSAGIAQYPEDGHNLQELYLAADAALYRAKELGRSRVVPISGLTCASKLSD